MSFTETWKNADPDAIGGDDTKPPEPGTYDVALDDASAFQSKAGDDWVKLEWRVVSAQQNGHAWTELYGFKTQGAANFTKKVCRDLGVDINAVADLEGLSEALQQPIGQYYTVEVVQNGEYRNTYLRSEGPVAPDIPIPDEPAQESVADDSPVPF